METHTDVVLNKKLWAPAEDNVTEVSHALAFQVLKTLLY